MRNWDFYNIKLRCVPAIEDNIYIHKLGTKCKPLMAKGMNIELTAQKFPLISTRTAAETTHLVQYAGTKKPLFVHVLNTTPATDDSLHEHLAYICTLTRMPLIV